MTDVSIPAIDSMAVPMHLKQELPLHSKTLF